ncbi:magnesium transporter [Crateriforma conspicua]|uniref:Magnesium transporter MgtE n=1 Tax=Crateriforma conspicua TaxID=2527996 RepID=A0A5C5Y7E6_9PLAN|nr:magnesium transporter [Crateriforma conspicua]QDV64828.1 Magnesium transporter MgtE [Crateriforma conspicua]TWT70225.1 Magnesium transporter MgtE [Crateriforma conspicua]
MTNTLFLPELREMLADNNRAELEEFCTTLNAGRTAEFMEGLSDAEVWQVLQFAQPERRSEIFGYFDEERQLSMLAQQPTDEVAELVEELAADDRVDLLQQLDDEHVDTILPLLPVEERRDIQRLRSYAEGTAGSLMTTEVAKLADRLTAREALEELSRQASELETIYYLYVVDDDNHLRGIVSTRQLVSSLAQPHRTLREMMETDVVVAMVDEDQESVAEKVEHFNLLAIPVLDSGRQLLGIITHDDVIDVVREELTEDAQRIAAVTPLERDFLRIGLVTLSWKRGIWLTILFFAALLTAFALRHYELELETYAWLVWFIPLIISAGGNSGSQSATLVITAMTGGEIELRDWRTVLMRESVVSLMLGGFIAVIGYAVAFFIAPSPSDALVIPLTLLAVMITGCLCGATLPLVFKRLGLDPALMSNPFVAGIVDIMGIVIYINVARMILSN